MSVKLLHFPRRIPPMMSSDTRYQGYLSFCRDRDLPSMDYEKWLRFSDTVHPEIFKSGRSREHISWFAAKRMVCD
jgi:hypothetical protein